MNTCKCSENENIFLPREAKILKVEQVTDLNKRFTLQLADKNQSGSEPSEFKPFYFNPGQILEISLFGYGEIPIGLASSPTQEDSFEVVIRTVGRVSTALNSLKTGDSLFIRGPLGHGFDLKEFQNNNVLIVAGGLGICPTRSLINYILDRRGEFKDFTLFYGSQSPDRSSIQTACCLMNALLGFLWISGLIPLRSVSMP